MITLTGVEASPAAAITEADLAGFAAKLEAWYETLPPGEQAVLQRLLACAEGMVSEECEVAGYGLPGIGARLARIFATGLMAATLAAPLTASAAPALSTSVNTNLFATDGRTPEEHIRGKAIALGTNFTGPAVSGLESVPNGFRIRYQKCDIYYSPSTGSHEVHGDIQAKYNTLGGPSSGLGLPATDEQINGDGIGRHNEFANNASIYWSPHTGPHAVSGTTRKFWVAQGAELSPFGYPTLGLQTQNGGQWTDFQNNVMYLENSQLRFPETALLEREPLVQALKNFFGGDAVFTKHQFYAKSLEIRDVSDTGFGFSQSRNRLIHIRIEGEEPSSHFLAVPHATFLLDMSLLFFAQQEADASTTLRVALDHQSAQVTSRDDTRPLANWVDQVFVKRFASPAKLIDVTIPAAVPVLSFKVLEDGALKLFLPPGGGSPLVQLAVQLAFDRLAK